jgi:hypothetical protein
MITYADMDMYAELSKLDKKEHVQNICRYLKNSGQAGCREKIVNTPVYEFVQYIPNYCDFRSSPIRETFSTKEEFDSKDIIKTYTELDGFDYFSVATGRMENGQIYRSLMVEKTNGEFILVGFLTGRPPWIPDWTRQDMRVFEGE